MSYDINRALPVTGMTISQLEEELEIIEMAYGIFSASGIEETLDFLPHNKNPIRDAIKEYGDRIRDIKNEIFERQVLVKS